MATNQPHHIIAIGASAGGMEEINTFFDHTPLDGVSYVIVQHLSPDFKSRMVELLARHSKLVVVEARSGMPVQCNQVYLIPSDKFMTIKDNTLFLSAKQDIKSPHLTINTFFSSLAADYGKNAIGVILSGLGSDGSEGAKAIKNAGGMVMARNPETSEFANMPSSAIATGMVDFILEPGAMPDAIADYIKNEGALTIEQADDEKNLAAIMELIRERLPLDFTDYKPATIMRRTKRRASFGNFTTLAAYLAHLRSSPDEIQALTQEFLISVTAFFRDPDAFAQIRANVIPNIINGLGPEEELKVWVAGCATGEEAYSMAIAIAEQLGSERSETVVKIFATDIDSAALSFAGKGIYGPSVKKQMPEELLEKYFTPEGENYRIVPQIRKMLIFALHDLVKNPPYCNMHLISCRNLLIYMAPVLQKKIFTMMLFGLRKHGYLFLGSSENPMPILKNLEVVHKKWKIYRSLESRREVSFEAFSMPEYLDARSVPIGAKQQFAASSTGNHFTDAVQESLAQNLDYLALCVNENDQVLKSFGDSSKFLLHKHFSSNLTELLPKALAVAYNTLRKEVLESGALVSLSGVPVVQGTATISVTLSVSPLATKGEEGIMLVSLSPDKGEPVQPAATFDEKIYLDRYVINLEQELRELKERLNAADEKLDASNENLQSFNEELISANEEMQSTNEEMQSVNEELHTINSDYQLKNKELLEINDDLNNYFRSNVNGQLFIDRQLRLMKFSPGTVKQINLLESDIGRPLSNISTNIKFETIIEDIKKVLEDGSVITKEIETNNGKWYQIMTMPYVQQSDKKSTGAIITFNDITDLKMIQQQLDNSNRMLGIAIGSAAMGTWSVELSTGEFVPSPRLKQIFGFLAEEPMSLEAATAQIDPEFREMVSAAMEATASNGIKFDVEYPIRGLRDGELRWVRGVGDISNDLEGEPKFFTGILLDITLAKQDDLRKNDFIAMVSHELKTPLTLLQAHMQLMEAGAKKTLDVAYIPGLEKALVQVKKMGVLVNGFLNVSRIGAGQIYLNLEEFAIDLLVSEIVEEIRMLTTSHQIVLDQCDALMVRADRDKIGQVINNFLSNAVKYSEKGSDIVISCSDADGWAQISVSDKGAGIEPEDQKKLFDRFYRSDKVQVKGTAGFGLGLYLSAEIIGRHGGKVWVESQLGKGSTFHLSLPVLQ